MSWSASRRWRMCLFRWRGEVANFTIEFAKNHTSGKAKTWLICRSRFKHGPLCYLCLLKDNDRYDDVDEGNPAEAREKC